MKFSLKVIALLLFLVIAKTPAQANVVCEWFGYCVYESPGFKITIVDQETGQPLAGVHALAEWIQYGSHGTGGPLMVQDAVSGADGVLAFPAWGPLRGSSAGLSLNQDPIITLFKSGYLPLTLNNHPGRDERARVRGFTQSGQTFKMEVFKGNMTVWVQELTNAAFPPSTRLSGAEREEIRSVYINRYRLLKVEVEKLPRNRKDVEHLIDTLERSIRFLQGDGKQ